MKLLKMFLIMRSEFLVKNFLAIRFLERKVYFKGGSRGDQIPKIALNKI